MAQLTAVTEYMVVLEGNSRPQNQAIAQNIEEKMMEAHNREPKTQVTKTKCTRPRSQESTELNKSTYVLRFVFVFLFFFLFFFVCRCTKAIFFCISLYESHLFFV